MTDLRVADDPAAFEADVRPHLEADEATNGLLLGFLGRLAPTSGAPLPFLAAREVDGRVVAAAYLTDLNLILSAGMGEAAEALVAALRARGLDLPGVVGPEADAVAVAAAWTRATGAAPAHEVAQGLHVLTEVVPPNGVAGHMRPMADGDVALVAAWVLGFHRDALPFQAYAPEAAHDDARRRPAAGMTYLWEVDGAPVAMAALSRPTAHGITVNAVYTPPAHRRRGYAAALVAALSAEGLRRGKAFCVLYTDLANPTANGIYRRIGYRQVGRSRMVRFG